MRKQTHSHVRDKRANGERYRLVGGTRQRHFAGINFKPRKVPENAATPTSRVHALLGGSLTFVIITVLIYNHFHDKPDHEACVPIMSLLIYIFVKVLFQIL
jgi:hypothetical protein